LAELQRQLEVENARLQLLQKDVKMLIGSPYILPPVALADPMMTLSMPRGVTAATGMDALTHCIEAYVSLKAQPITDTIALAGIRLIPNKRIGIVEKRFGGGSVRSGLIALQGEAGFQPEVLRGGFHWRMKLLSGVIGLPAASALVAALSSGEK
jgi:hypothetical protein